MLLSTPTVHTFSNRKPKDLPVALQTTNLSSSDFCRTHFIILAIFLFSCITFPYIYEFSFSPTSSFYNPYQNHQNYSNIITIGYCNGGEKKKQRAAWTISQYFPFRKRMVSVRYNGMPWNPNETNYVDILICDTDWHMRFSGIRKQRKKRVPLEETVMGWDRGVHYADQKIWPHFRGRPFLISFDTEAFGPHVNKRDDVTLISQSSRISWPNPSVYYCSGCIRESYHERKLNSTRDLTNPRGLGSDYNLDISRDLLGRKFMLFMAGHRFCKKTQHSWNVLMRAAVFDEISDSYKHVTAYGACRRNAKEPRVYSNGLHAKDYAYVYDRPMLSFMDFKFSLVFENDKVEGYFTEKLLNGYYARTIPLYWGATNVDSIINSDRALHLNVSESDIAAAWEVYGKGDKDFNADVEARIKFLRKRFKREIGDLIARVKYLDENDDAYLEMLRKPLLKKIEGSEFDLKVVVDRLVRVLRSSRSYVLDDEFIQEVDTKRWVNPYALEVT